ncbi:hypothetical protein [Dyadobacter tibetensis]|uniref:hypothetical protein n=1 Tax=Dyadobacter tibetensis TaxID=1211851 RepID=UPI0004729C0A|nr:hypothetical protein [Dyadobacter tibetensis]
MNLSRIIILLLFLLTFDWSTALGQEVRRIEIPIKGNVETIRTIPIGEKGVIVISKPTKDSFLVRRFSTDLDNIWSIEGPLGANLDLITTTYDGKSIYLLFNKTKSSIYKIVKVNIGPGFLETFHIETMPRFELTDFVSMGYSIFMAGKLRNEAVLLYSQLDTPKTRILPSAMQGSSVIQSLEVDSLHGLVHVNYAIKNGKETKLLVRAYDDRGRVALEVEQVPEPEYSIINGRLQIIDNNTQLLVGTYGYRNMQSTRSAASQGIFISKFVDGKVQYARYHSFTDFSNFFQFLNPRQQEKLEKRIDKKKEAGQDLKLNYRLLLHDLIPHNENYLLLAEVYYPEFRYQTPGMGSGYQSMMGYPFGRSLYNPYLYNPMYNGRAYNQQIFDGFTYTHAIVAGISATGNIIWDNHINFEGVKSMDLRQKVKLQTLAGDQVKLAYTKSGKVMSKTISQNRVVKGEASFTLPTGVEGDKIRKTETDDIDFWYDHYYIAWGSQRISNPNTSSENRGRRNIYYLAKIEH